MMTNRNISIKKALFYVSLGIYIVISIINTTMFAKYFGDVYRYVMIFCFSLLLIREVMGKLRRKRIKLWFIAATIVGISLLGDSGANTILTIIIFSVAASDLDFEEIGRFSYKLIFISLLFVILCSWIGIIEDYVYVMGGRTRHYLGFLYALQPAGLTFELVTLNLYLNRNKKNNKGKWILLALCIYIFSMTKSRFTFFLEIVMFIADYVYRKRESTRK